MRDREWTTVTLLVLLMLTVWLGFLFHRSPRFAGSPLGGLLAVSGASLMLVPLATYWVTKRAPSIKRRLSAWMSMRTLLTVHIYTGLLGAILVLLHTGHKFDSPLGMALTAMVLLVALSGFVGRCLMSQIGLKLREKQARLERLQLVFEGMGDDHAQQEVGNSSVRSTPRVRSLFGSPPLTGEEDSSTSVGAVAGGIADLEYSIAVHAWFKKWFQKWLRFHRAITGVLCFLLALHVGAGIYYGLRWFQ